MGAGMIKLSIVWKMLKKCADGHVRDKTLHHWRITYNDRTWSTLPLGPHGARFDSEVHVGQVRRMARHLGILPCAKAHIPQL